MEDIRQKIQEQIERMKIVAEDFLANNTKVFIKYQENFHKEVWYACDILIVGEDHLYIRPFEGNDVGKDVQLLWAKVIDISEYSKGEKQ